MAGEKAKADGRTSRSRSRSPQRGSGEAARGKAVRQASQMQSAMIGLRAAPSGATAQYAVSAEDADIFSGVPGMGPEPETPGVPGASPAAPGEASTSELRQAAGTQLPCSTPPSPAPSPMETEA